MNRQSPFETLFGSDFFTDFFGRDAWKDFDRMFASIGNMQMQTFPPHNIYALKDGSARIDLALAGYNQSNISLKAEDGRIIIEGKGQEDEGSCNCDDDCECVVHGIKSSSFKKSISMPSKFDLSKASAKMKDGMLSITIPLAEERKAKDIKVDISTE